MTWPQAVETLAARAASRYGVPVSDALRLAVRLGLEAECDNWLHQKRS